MGTAASGHQSAHGPVAVDVVVVFDGGSDVGSQPQSAEIIVATVAARGIFGSRLPLVTGGGALTEQAGMETYLVAA